MTDTNSQIDLEAAPGYWKRELDENMNPINVKYSPEGILLGIEKAEVTTENSNS